MFFFQSEASFLELSIEELFLTFPHSRFFFRANIPNVFEVIKAARILAEN